jgi:hypothetical protein
MSSRLENDTIDCAGRIKGVIGLNARRQRYVLSRSA